MHRRRSVIQQDGELRGRVAPGTEADDPAEIHRQLEADDPFIELATPLQRSGRLEVRDDAPDVHVLLLAEQVPRGGTDILLCSLVGFVERKTANDRDRTAVELPHDELRGGGDLVGHRDLGDAELVPLGVALADIALQGRKAGYADGDVGVSLPPGPAER